MVGFLALGRSLWVWDRRCFVFGFGFLRWDGEVLCLGIEGDRGVWKQSMIISASHCALFSDICSCLTQSLCLEPKTSVHVLCLSQVPGSFLQFKAFKAVHVRMASCSGADQALLYMEHSMILLAFHCALLPETYSCLIQSLCLQPNSLSNFYA